MKRETVYCDNCDIATEDPRRVGNFDLCANCNELWWKLMPTAIGEVQKGVAFSVAHRVELLDLIERNDSPEYWGTEGMKLRDDIIKSFKEQ